MTAEKRCEPNFGSWEVNGQVVYNLAEQRALKPNPTGKKYNKRKANGRIEETFLVQSIETNYIGYGLSFIYDWLKYNYRQGKAFQIYSYMNKLSCKTVYGLPHFYQAHTIYIIFTKHLEHYI